MHVAESRRHHPSKGRAACTTCHRDALKPGNGRGPGAGSVRTICCIAVGRLGIGGGQDCSSGPCLGPDTVAASTAVPATASSFRSPAGRSWRDRSGCDLACTIPGLAGRLHPRDRVSSRLPLAAHSQRRRRGAAWQRLMGADRVSHVERCLRRAKIRICYPEMPRAAGAQRRLRLERP